MAIDKEIMDIAKTAIGEYLRTIRRSKDFTPKKISETSGLSIKEIIEIENGTSQYNMDSFLAYIHAIDCYFYLANREGKHLDEVDLKNKMFRE